MPDPAYADRPEDLAPREAVLSMSGLDFMQALAEGRLKQAAMWRTMGFQLVEVAPGRTLFRGTPAFAHTNPTGGVHGGWYGTLLDTAMGCAVMTAVPRGSWYTTLEYKVNLTRALPEGTEVACEGVVEHAGRTTAVATGTVRGLSDGRLYATGSTTCVILQG